MKRAALVLLAASACGKPSLVEVSLGGITASGSSAWVESSREVTDRLVRSARDGDAGADVQIRALGPDGEDVPALTMLIVRQSVETSTMVTVRNTIDAEDEAGQSGAKERGFQIQTASTCHDRYCDWNMYIAADGASVNQVTRVWKVDHRIVQLTCGAMDKNIFATCQLPMPPTGAELVDAPARPSAGGTI